MESVSKKRYFFVLSLFLTLLFALAGFFVAPARAEWAGHLVVSAVQITEGEGKTNHDFIEIYNPTINDINLKGYRLIKRTRLGTSDTSIKSWTDGAIIRAHGWWLWASSDDAVFPASVGADDFTKQTISSDNGIAIRSGAADTGEIVDSLAWGMAENIFKEGSAPANPGVGEALVRKPSDGNGNGEDTDNNASDFIVVPNFIPHNSQSAAVPSGESDQTSSPSPVPSSSPEPSTSPVAGVSPISKNLPQAEAGPDKEAVTGETIDFDGSDSFDPGGKDLLYNWSFGDRESGKGENARHAYSSAGEYTVILKVTNGVASAEDSLHIKVSAPEFSDKIILSELLPDPVGSDKDGEWIELANTGDKRVNLRGWILGDKAGGGGKSYAFEDDTFVEPQDFLVIKRQESGLVLPNKGGELNILWYDGKNLSKVSYGAAKEGQSYALIKSTWQWTGNLTPGKENIGALAAISSVKKADEMARSETKGAKVDLAATGASAQDNTDENNVGNSSTDARFAPEADESAVLKEDAVSPIGIDSGNKSFTNNIPETKSNDLAAGELGAIPGLGNSEKPAEENNNEAKNNPWFWGDMVLSVLSLFLVWRYQGLRKKNSRI